MLSTLVIVNHVLERASSCYYIIKAIGDMAKMAKGDGGKTTLKPYSKQEPMKKIKKRNKSGHVILTYSQATLNQFNMKWNEWYGQKTICSKNSDDEKTASQRKVTWSHIPLTRANRFGLYQFDSSCTKLFN